MEMFGSARLCGTGVKDGMPFPTAEALPTEAASGQRVLQGSVGANPTAELDGHQVR